jgi:hypothetical protein
MFAVVIVRAKEDGQVVGDVPHLVEWGIYITICQRYNNIYEKMI